MSTILTKDRTTSNGELFLKVPNNRLQISSSIQERWWPVADCFKCSFVGCSTTFRLLENHWTLAVQLPILIINLVRDFMLCFFVDWLFKTATILTRRFFGSIQTCSSSRRPQSKPGQYPWRQKFHKLGSTLSNNAHISFCQLRKPSKSEFPLQCFPEVSKLETMLTSRSDKWGNSRRSELSLRLS